MLKPILSIGFACIAAYGCVSHYVPAILVGTLASMAVYFDFWGSCIEE